jgi:hypothetical protein
MKAPVLALVSVLMALPAMAQGKAQSDLAHSLIGTWRIVSCTELDLDTRKVSALYGDHPVGYLQYSPGGHLVVFLAAGELARTKPPYTDADRLAIYRAMAGYAGTYSVKGNTVTHNIIGAWRPDWIGEQTRYVALNGDRLTIKTQQNLSNLTGHRTVTTLTWERVE